MVNTYSKIYLHIVFAVKNREALLHKSWRHRLFQYASKTLTNMGQYSLAVNGHYDHIHILINYSGKILIKDIVREIKKSMTNFIKGNNLSPFKFEWQNGYGVFSNGYKEIDGVINYIRNQEHHHTKRSFKEEYMTLLEKYEIEFKEEYVFEFLDIDDLGFI